MKKLHIAFFGAPDFAANILERIVTELHETLTVSSVFTQPDMPAGRKQTLTPTPVKLMAQKHNIPVIDNLKLKISNLQLQGIDLVLLYAYGTIIPKDILKIPRWGFWNIHPSLLPKYRGPSPIVYPLLLNDAHTGVSLIEMDERMDHGPILAQKEYQIEDTDTRQNLEKRLSDIGYELFKQSVHKLIDGKLQKEKQDEAKRTYTRLLTKQDGFVPFPVVQKIIRHEQPENEVVPKIIGEYYRKYLPLTTSHQSLATYNLFRAFTPWPGLWTLIKINGIEKRLKITGMALPPTPYPLHPTITHVQLEGKKETDLSTFLSAYSVFT